MFATEISINSNKSETSLNEEFLVDIVVDSDTSINAIEGRLVFDEKKIFLKEIRDGASVINLWVEKPHIDQSGDVFFSGITPGGLTGIENLLFSVVFQAKDTGITAIEMADMRILANDGQATEISASIKNTKIIIKYGDNDTSKEVLEDKELPENFNPTIEKNELIFDGKYFLVFATEDKISGIDHYEIREGEWGIFHRAESPYALRSQSLTKDIHIKAIDKAKNERLIILNAQYEPVWYQQYINYVIIIIVVLFVVVLSFKKKW
ncbi:MAG: cohesin domain-containing protein [Patescibacteria group bacterium]